MDLQNKLQWVKKRDGRVVAFAKQKIADAIYKALKSTGKDDQLLAQEMSEAVTLYLTKHASQEIPDIETIQDAVERVLVEMKFFETAKAYILYRDKRARLRQSMQQGKGQMAPDPALAAQSPRWDRERLIRSLMQELQVPRRLAEHIADIVEANVLAAREGVMPPDQLDLTIH